MNDTDYSGECSVDKASKFDQVSLKTKDKVIDPNT